VIGNLSDEIGSRYTQRRTHTPFHQYSTAGGNDGGVSHDDRAAYPAQPARLDPTGADHRIGVVRLKRSWWRQRL